MEFTLLKKIITGDVANVHNESDCHVKLFGTYDRDLVYVHESRDNKCFGMYYKSDTVTKFNMLNDDQKKVFLNVLDFDFNIVQAPAGSGKSFLINIICYICSGAGIFVKPTSTTNKSSQNINGCTIHSFTDIRVNTKSTMQIFRNMRNEKKQMLKSVRLIIVDEISMMSGDFFEKMNNIFKIVRDSDEWFGGVRLMLCGDLLQLPVVRNNRARDEDIQTILDSKIWSKIAFKFNEMDTIVRQTDKGFIDALNEIRTHTGYPKKMSASTVDVLHSMIRPCDTNNNQIVYISGLNSECDYINQKLSATMLSENKNFNFQEKTYTISDEDGGVSARGNTLVLCVGMKVIFTDTVHTIAGSCVAAGTVGMVIDFVYSSSLTDNGSMYSAVHGATGCNYSKLLLAEGRQLEDVKVVNTKLYGEWDVFPVVRVDCKTIIPTYFYRYKLVYDTLTKCNRATNVTVCMPLSMAYAITVHKAQGCTLNSIVLNVYSLFEYQHFYTALSRVRTRQDVYILPGNNYECGAEDFIAERKRVLEYIHCKVKFANPHILNCLRRHYGPRETDTDETGSAEINGRV